MPRLSLRPFFAPMLAMLMLLVLANAGVAETAQTPLAAPPSLEGKRILILGDSITAGGTYASMLEYYLTRRNPDHPPDIISIGLASETVAGLSEKQHPFPRPCLFERLGRALEKIKPDVIFACYGMNDGTYHPLEPDLFKAFQDGVEKLIATAHDAHAELILLTPPPYDPLPVLSKTLEEGAADYGYKTAYRHYDDVLSTYSQWEMSLNGRGAFVIDLNSALTQAILERRKTQPDFSFAPKDGIHPNALGHLIMAQTIMDSLQIHHDEGSPETILESLQKDPLYKLVDAHRRGRSEGWLAYVGYTRGKTVHSDEIEPTETKAKALQNEIVHKAREAPATVE